MVTLNKHLIPHVVFEVKKGDILEEFDTYLEMCFWAMDMKDIRVQAEEEYQELDWDDQEEYTVYQYAANQMERLLGENEYILARVPK